MTSPVAMPWIPARICRKVWPLRLQSVGVEPHCHSLSGTVRKANNNYAQE